MIQATVALVAVAIFVLFLPKICGLSNGDNPHNRRILAAYYYILEEMEWSDIPKYSGMTNLDSDLTKLKELRNKLKDNDCRLSRKASLKMIDKIIKDINGQKSKIEKATFNPPRNNTVLHKS